MIIKYKRVLFILFTLFLSYLNLRYLTDLPYTEKLLMRIPQVLLLLFIYRKYIYKGYNEWLRKLRIQNNLIHTVMIIIGTIVLIHTLIQGMLMEDIGEKVLMIDFFDPHLYLDLLVSVMTVIPTAYALTQYARLMIMLDLWLYDNKKVLLIPVIIIEDIFLTALVTTII